MSLRMSSSVTSPVPISLMPALVEAALDELLHELRADARGHEDEQRVGLGVAHLLQEGREVRVAQRHAQVLDTCAALGRERVREGLLGVDARAVVG